MLLVHDRKWIILNVQARTGSHYMYICSLFCLRKPNTPAVPTDTFTTGDQTTPVAPASDIQQQTTSAIPLDQHSSDTFATAVSIELKSERTSTIK